MEYKKTIMYGCSDDLVEFEGNIRDEIGSWGDCQIVVFSNGLIAKIKYAPNQKAIWEIEIVNSVGKYEIKHIGEDDTEEIEGFEVSYSDCLIIDEKIDWCIGFSKSKYNLCEVNKFMDEFKKIEKITSKMIENWGENEGIHFVGRI